jgi:type IV conjugative transfer system lipoprotein TraV
MNIYRSITRGYQLALLAGILASLGGCASWFTPIGSNTYDCNRRENPDSPYCHSFAAVEKATSNDVPKTRYDEKMSIAETDKLTGIAPVKKTDDKATTSNDASLSGAQQPVGSGTMPQQVTSSALPPGTPVRVGPVIQRIWIKSFDDNNDMLTSDQIIYKEVVPTHWAGQSPIESTQGSTSGGLPGAYPHMPVTPPPSTTRSQSPEQSEKIDNTSFSQPGAEVPAGQTATPLSDNSAQTMPN